MMNRQHQTKAGPDRPSFQPINANIIRGSGIGPVAYIFNTIDLHTISPSNILLKSPMILTYLSPLLTLHQSHANFNTYPSGPAKTTSKSCEMIIHQSSTKILNYPPVHHDLKRVEQITAIGVTFNNTIFLWTARQPDYR